MSNVIEQLEDLKSSVESQFPGTVKKLQSGTHMLVVTDLELFKGLDPDRIRHVGELVALCHAYEAGFMFVSPHKMAMINSEESTTCLT